MRDGKKSGEGEQDRGGGNWRGKEKRAQDCQVFSQINGEHHKTLQARVSTDPSQTGWSHDRVTPC